MRSHGINFLERFFMLFCHPHALGIPETSLNGTVFIEIKHGIVCYFVAFLLMLFIKFTFRDVLFIWFRRQSLRWAGLKNKVCIKRADS